jgi:hypothetical protein
MEQVHPCSWRPTTGPYPVPDESSPHLPTPPYFPKVPSNITLSSIPSSYEWSLSFTFSDQNIARISHFFHAPVYLMLRCLLFWGRFLNCRGFWITDWVWRSEPIVRLSSTWIQTLRTVFGRSRLRFWAQIPAVQTCVFSDFPQYLQVNSGRLV